MSEQSMNKLPAPEVPGDTDAERFSNAVKMILSVPTNAVTKDRVKARKA
jgi:hypothetical protein